MIRWTTLALPRQAGRLLVLHYRRHIAASTLHLGYLMKVARAGPATTIKAITNATVDKKVMRFIGATPYKVARYSRLHRWLPRHLSVPPSTGRGSTPLPARASSRTYLRPDRSNWMVYPAQISQKKEDP
jgi:hypothetical protein